MDQSRKRLIAKVLSRPATQTDSEETGEFGLITLNDPPLISASVDIIFIHGLGGGSRRTWSYSDNVDHFWPKSWLPVDLDFQDVRIHTFGYKSDWANRQQSVLNIHDFSQSLIGGMRNDPSIWRDKSGIILVGHSMGGCVAKEAYILARQDPWTPHHGSDMAKVLESMLIVAWGKDKPFVTDLKPNSSALSLINDRFRYVATDLSLWTFYETLPVIVGPISRMVVRKGAAILGYDKEWIQAMHADHRHLCKFNNRNDPNYKILRNALHFAVDEIKDFLLNTLPSYLPLGASNAYTSNFPLNELCSRLRSFLKVDDFFESEHETNQELKEPGSCLWFTEKPFFTKWKLGDGPQILWLTGRPGTGKSIMASHVIDQLNAPACRSYFFFEHSSTNKSTLSDCFRSLAFQMTMQDDMVRQEIMQLEDGGIAWDKGNETSVWMKLFVGRIFKLSFRVPHFWVIDGLGKCAHFKNLFSKRLLSKLTHKKNLRVFFTSRGTEGIERGIASLGSQVNPQLMSNTDTLDNIRLFLTTKLKELNRLESDEAQNSICEKIPKSRLDLFSGRMLESIEIDRTNIGLAKSILTWVLTACRPLTTDELRCAVKLDLNQTLQNLNKAIPTICGQLVFIDQADHVQIIHETAREFLLGKEICSELAVQKKQIHTHLASVLLQYLSKSGFESEGWNHRGLGKPKGFGKPVPTTLTNFALVDYACNFFSEHISRGSSKDDVSMNNICTFLKENSVLLWIEHIAQSHDLSNITRAALNLRGYLGRRAKYVLPTDPSTNLVEG
ncbi:uncharacterized protein N7483_011167 [Penicillium malachiteum]|uniref:uncharacterized protein n=1 Tax=Penicillium malachiteum TaxID=1324776 RepID=UPI002546F0A6|nr:uncharacterized protein N7483_011167 [Penicillium malachiteum]KAJ5713986.1 hypothetical protein N7483_011167 [Penicillium malachiteum]